MPNMFMIGVLAVTVLPLQAQGVTRTVEPRPAVEITEYSESEPLGRIIGAATLSDGVIAVGDNSLLKVFLFSKDGKPQASFGRRGAGPGEFQAMVWIGVCENNTLSVLDIGQQRINDVDAQGKMLGSRAARPATGFFPGHRPSPYTVKCDRNGAQAMVGWPNEGLPAKEGLHRGTVDVAIAKPGASFTRLGTFPGGERFRYPTSDGPVTFGRTLSVAVSKTRVFVGTADSFFVEIFDLDGVKKGEIRRRAALKPFRAADRARYKEQRLAQLPAGMNRERAAQSFDAMFIPDVLPPYTRFVVDDQNRLWIEEGHAPVESTREWWGFKDDGTPVGSIRVPAELELYEITSSTVLGKWTDEDGAESVRVYRLTSSTQE